VVALEPLRVTAVQRDGRLELDAYDAAGLFRRAGAELAAGRCQAAVELYRRLDAEFPEADEAVPSLYNAGLCLDRLGRHEEAAAAFDRILERDPGHPDAKDALFRQAESLERSESWTEAAATCDRLLARSDLRPVERVEALSRKGAALRRHGDPAGARRALEEASRVYRLGRGIAPADPVVHYSRAEFEIGEIVHDEMRAVELPPDEALLEERLEHKADLLLEAQRLYTRVIRIGDPHWAAAAAYRIGALYHHLRVDILAAEPPPGLSEEEREIYLEILRDRTRVLLHKAVRQWERTLGLAVRLGLDNEWIARTTDDLRRIREVLVIEVSGIETD
jgi:tetratricopeptide (TPR) repeat protein